VRKGQQRDGSEVAISSAGQTMNLNQLFNFVERLRKEVIGEPRWIRDKRVYEYLEGSTRVVAVLKLIRAAQGVSALKILCEHGLFVDLGAIRRCVGDCEAEVYFLLEEYPKTSNAVDQFVKAFFDSTIDEYMSAETHSVQSKKVRNAMLRVLRAEHNQKLRSNVERIYKTFSGYVHANYAHIMETYNGNTLDFNLGGVPDIQQRLLRMEQVELAANDVLHMAAFIAQRRGLKELYCEIVQSWQ
jgi:hypothetical protein